MRSLTARRVASSFHRLHLNGVEAVAAEVDAAGKTAATAARLELLGSLHRSLALRRLAYGFGRLQLQSSAHGALSAAAAAAVPVSLTTTASSPRVLARDHVDVLVQTEPTGVDCCSVSVQADPMTARSAGHRSSAASTPAGLSSRAIRAGDHQSPVGSGSSSSRRRRGRLSLENISGASSEAIEKEADSLPTSLTVAGTMAELMSPTPPGRSARSGACMSPSPAASPEDSGSGRAEQNAGRREVESQPPPTKAEDPNAGSAFKQRWWRALADAVAASSGTDSSCHSCGENTGDEKTAARRVFHSGRTGGTGSSYDDCAGTSSGSLSDLDFAGDGLSACDSDALDALGLHDSDDSEEDDSTFILDAKSGSLGSPLSSWHPALRATASQLRAVGVASPDHARGVPWRGMGGTGGALNGETGAAAHPLRGAAKGAGAPCVEQPSRGCGGFSGFPAPTAYPPAFGPSRATPPAITTGKSEAPAPARAPRVLPPPPMLGTHR